MKRYLILLLLAVSCQLVQPELQEGRVLYVGYEDLAALSDELKSLGVELGVVVEELKVAELLLPPGLELSLLDGLELRFYELPQARELAPPPGLAPLELFGQWYLETMRAAEAWQIARGEGVIVAVADLGIDGSHPDLQGQVVTGYDAVSGQEILPGSDLSGGEWHGTHVAGLIAARGELQGMAPGAKIMPLRLFSPNYVGDIRAAEAIVWAVNHQAKVINISWGGRGYSQVLVEAIGFAFERGVTIVAAAGNQGLGIPSYPAAYPGVIAVTAVDPQGRRSPFSNHGPYITVAAPGERILSTVPGGYSFMSGTSMAAPLVSATVALIYDRDEVVRPYHARSMLERSQGPLGIDARAVLEVPRPPLQERGCLRLWVRWEDGTPVMRADVALKAPDNGPVYWLRTDSRGLARYEELASGPYTLQVAAPAAETFGLRPEDRVVIELPVRLEVVCSVPLTVAVPRTP